MTGLPAAQSWARTSFAKSFYGLFNTFFPEGEPDGSYDDEDDFWQAPPPAKRPQKVTPQKARSVAQSPVVHQPHKATPQTFHQDQMAPAVPYQFHSPQTFHQDQIPPLVSHQAQKARPQTFHQSQLAPPETFFVDSEASSFIYEPEEAESFVFQPLEAEAESIYIAANSADGNDRSQLSMTSYGPAPVDLNSFHRTSFTRDQLQFRQQQLQIAEQQRRPQQLPGIREHQQNHAPQHNLAHQRRSKSRIRMSAHRRKRKQH